MVVAWISDKILFLSLRFSYAESSSGDDSITSDTEVAEVSAEKVNRRNNSATTRSNLENIHLMLYVVSTESSLSSLNFQNNLMQMNAIYCCLQV